MKIPETITELMSMVSAYNLFDNEVKIWYEAYAKHKDIQFRQSNNSYSIWQNGLCLLMYFKSTRTQIIESPQSQIAGQELNMN